MMTQKYKFDEKAYVIFNVVQSFYNIYGGGLSEEFENKLEEFLCYLGDKFIEPDINELDYSTIEFGKISCEITLKPEDELKENIKYNKKIDFDKDILTLYNVLYGVYMIHHDRFPEEVRKRLDPFYSFLVNYYEKDIPEEYEILEQCHYIDINYK